MSTTRVTLPDQLDNVEMARLRSEVRALQGLVRELLARLAAPAPAGGPELAGMSNRELVDLLFEVRGQRSCAVLRTRISQRIERESGRRSRGRGQDRV
jgi:hypothetical protein